MTLYEELRTQSGAAIAAMQAAALHARSLHARAELLRHMLSTAAKPGANLDSVTHEWMAAWKMTDWPEVAAEARRFTEAVLAGHDPAIRTSFAALEAALVLHGTTLADEMAWRSRCAHGWWAAVAPQAGAPFWEQACPEDCLER